MKRLVKIFGYGVLIFVLLSLGFYAWLKWGLAPDIPQVKDRSALQLQRVQVGKNEYRVGANWLRQIPDGLWEEYVQGAPFERGVITGKLEKDLLYSQEVAFVEQIHRLVPDDNYLHFLALFTRVFNRDLEDYMPEENKLEIYGESFSAPPQFNYIAPPFDRMLSYHAAHDIGHALVSLALVGCSSFAAWGSHTYDSTLIIGRNLDFYMGDDFAKNKIIYFCNPTEGHKFVLITWAGFMGCVSGMNDQGLTVTINAAKSDVPTKAKTPISILARHILQYAGNIDEAYQIAKKGQTFVCETFMIGSAADRRTALIEKSITKTALFQTDTNYILCTNHYQSDTFKNDKNNIENIKTSASMYRYKRLAELLNRYPDLDEKQAAAILRDQRGLHDKNIGMGNEKALNQLISHHAIIFEPEKLRFWVSANPYQLGEFVCYDLHKVFADAPNMSMSELLRDTSVTIPPDSFLYSQGWKDFLLFRKLKEQIKAAAEQHRILKNEQSTLRQFAHSNPEFWETPYWMGEYYRSRHQKDSALVYYKLALTKEINNTHEADGIRKWIHQLEQP